jgi:hypothetical protein
MNSKSNPSASVPMTQKISFWTRYVSQPIISGNVGNIYGDFN